MKKYSFLKLVFPIFVFLLFLSCESEPVELNSLQETEQSSIVAEEVDINALPHIGSAWGKITARSSSSKDNENLFIDESRVLKVTDSIGNETYALRVYTQMASDDNAFYNLLVTQRTDGTSTEPFIMKYSVDGEDTYTENGDGSVSFNGNMQVFSIDTFVDGLGNASRTGNPVPCQENPVQQNGSSGNGDGGGDGGYGHNNGSYNSTNTGTGNTTGGYGLSVVGLSNGGGGGGGFVIVGQGQFGVVNNSDNGDNANQKGSVTFKTGNDDCPEGEVVFPINDEENRPSCESFDFYAVGGTGVQVAAVNGIWDVVTKWGRCPGIGVAAAYQTYYFHLPSYINSGLAAEMSAAALDGAFYDLQKWFRSQSCGQMNTGVLAIKLNEFIKDNFEEIGGQATRNAPLGWVGVARPYIEDWDGSDRCY